MSGATDAINPVNPFFYSFGQFWAKNKINKTNKKTTKQKVNILLHFPVKGWPPIGQSDREALVYGLIHTWK